MAETPSLFSTQVRPDTEYFRTTYYPKTGAAAPSASDIFEMHPSLLYFHRPVHDDISLLADYGLLFVVDDGQRKRPYLPYERIHLDVELVDGEPAPV